LNFVFFGQWLIKVEKQPILLFLCHSSEKSTSSISGSGKLKTNIMLIHLAVIGTIILVFVSVQWLSRAKQSKQLLKDSFVDKQEATA
jgi:hypothetical protein